MILIKVFLNLFQKVAPTKGFPESELASFGDSRHGRGILVATAVAKCLSPSGIPKGALVAFAEAKFPFHSAIAFLMATES